MKIKNERILSILKKELESSLSLTLEAIALEDDRELGTEIDIYDQIRNVISNIEDIQGVN